MSDFLSIQQIEEEIAALCSKRAEMLYEEGIEEPYLVYDSTKNILNDNVWVLDPDYEKELIKMVFDEMPWSAEDREHYTAWLEEYGKNSCTTKCPNTGTPRCCCVCIDRFDCNESLTRCEDIARKSNGEFCSRRGGYNETK